MHLIKAQIISVAKPPTKRQPQCTRTRLQLPRGFADLRHIAFRQQHHIGQRNAHHRQRSPRQSDAEHCQQLSPPTACEQQRHANKRPQSLSRRLLLLRQHQPAPSVEQSLSADRCLVDAQLCLVSRIRFDCRHRLSNDDDNRRRRSHWLSDQIGGYVDGGHPKSIGVHHTDQQQQHDQQPSAELRSTANVV